MNVSTKRKSLVNQSFTRLFSFYTEGGTFAVWQYTQHRQQFVDQLNGLLEQYLMRMSVAA